MRYEIFEDLHTLRRSIVEANSKEEAKEKFLNGDFIEEEEGENIYYKVNQEIDIVEINELEED